MHLQLCERDWVLWGYVPRRPGQPRFACNVSPASFVFKNKQVCFQLPAPGSVEHERLTAWGWRFRGVDEVNSTSWRLANSREDCIEAARRHVANEVEHQPECGRMLERALGDIRVYEGGIL